MIAIKKGPVPQALVDYKLNKGSSFDDFSEKDAIRDSLIREQYGLCAYCMSRIFNDVTYGKENRQVHCKIEHFKAQTKYPELQLDYKNMLGCCGGNEGQSKKYQTCDTRKGDLDLMFNPADENDCKKMEIRFYKDGTIHSGNVDFDVQLNTVLNLNASHLVSARKSLLDAAFAVLNKTRGSRTKSQIQHFIDKYSALKNGNHMPFYYVVVYYLKKHLR